MWLSRPRTVRCSVYPSWAASGRSIEAPWNVLSRTPAPPGAAGAPVPGLALVRSEIAEFQVFRDHQPPHEAAEDHDRQQEERCALRFQEDAPEARLIPYLDIAPRTARVRRPPDRRAGGGGGI